MKSKENQAKSEPKSPYQKPQIRSEKIGDAQAMSMSGGGGGGGGAGMMQTCNGMAMGGRKQNPCTNIKFS